MRRHAVALLFLLVFAALPLGAQAAAPGVAPSAAPGEPEMVMPQVILRVEDLSVEKVVAQLPPEEELLPPARPIPALSESDLAVGDPVIPGPGGVPDVTLPPANTRLLASEVTLGAGMLNSIIGRMSLKTLGVDPRFTLGFNHETVDGYWGHAPGSGFDHRTDQLDGGLKFALGPFDVSLSGSFGETETALQGHSSFLARMARSLAGTADLSVSPLDWLTLGVGADGGTDSLTLTRTVPLSPSDLRASPRVSASARFGGVTLGLTSSYSYRSYRPDSGMPGADLQRFTVGSSFSANLPATFILAGDVGWFVNSAGLSLAPFSVSLTGTPWQFVTLSIAGGYKAQTYDLRDVVVSHELAVPGALSDDHGWFGASSVKLAFSRDLSASFALSFMQSNALPMGSTVQDPVTGLFLVSQGQAARLSADGGLRWGISPVFSLSAAWHGELLARPFFTPGNSISAEIVGLEPAGRFGGSLSLSMASVPGQAFPLTLLSLQKPVLRASGFWKVSDAVKLQLDGEDLLLPIFGGTRNDMGPFDAPGFRVMGLVGISL